MGLPFLLLVVVTGWSIGKAAMGRQVAAIDARQQGFAQRPSSRNSFRQVNRAMESLDPSSGMRRTQVTKDVRVARFLGNRVQPSSEVTVVVGTWDHNGVKEMGRAGPHVFLFPKLAKQAGSGIRSALKSSVKNFFNDVTKEIVSAATR